MKNESLSNDAQLRQLVEIIETELQLDPDHLEIDIEDGSIDLRGRVPSEQSYDDLEHLLYDTFDFEEIEFDVVVDEDLQAQEETLGSSGEDFGFEGPGGSASPRRQY